LFGRPSFLIKFPLVLVQLRIYLLCKNLRWHRILNILRLGVRLNGTSLLHIIDTFGKDLAWNNNKRDLGDPWNCISKLDVN
jgi:hypothetical protein